MTFRELFSFLKCAGEKKLKEVQLCIEGMYGSMHMNGRLYRLYTCSYLDVCQGSCPCMHTYVRI